MAPINLPDGSAVAEVILPDGAAASEVIAPDGNTVFSAIPDSAVSQYLPANYDNTNNEWPDEIGGIGTLSGSVTSVNSSGRNGETTLTIDGDKLQQTASANISTPFTTIVAVNTSTRGTIHDSTTTSDSRIAFRSANGKYALQNGSFVITDTASTTGSWLILTAHFDGANSFVRENQTQTADVDAGNEQIESFQIGKDAADGNVITADFGEMVVYDSLPVSEIPNEEQRLADKYAITF